jgi:hypothetical protein
VYAFLVDVSKLLGMTSEDQDQKKIEKLEMEMEAGQWLRMVHKIFYIIK